MHDHAWIAAHIPHQGSMCLLDRVESWDDDRVICTAISHRDADNPLRSHDRLGIAAGIEYAAQAMAVHGALLAASSKEADLREKPKAGFLASVRGATFHVERLDDLTQALSVEAVRIHSEANTIMYQFTVKTQNTHQLLLEGRATVIVNAGLLMPSSMNGTKT